jgi:hypothetical protein
MIIKLHGNSDDQVDELIEKLIKEYEQENLKILLETTNANN